ncbi:FCD domain-containing protein [Oceanobacillus sp. FSL K6-2867]|uniref:FadR/GntR family transcriptional regulator n=1 Tax=Oceanobacillus sp. FSL K6-2867 TaxID=2954748 RepID=UPI0030D83D85
MKNTSSKIKKVSTVDLVCEEMKKFILDSTWTLNEKIPSESELADYFGVNRFTVRMALQKLNMIGILETKVGDGSYVRSFDFDKHMREISEFYMTPKLLDDITEFRTVVEVECARLAIQRATPEEIEILGEYCGQFEKHIVNYINSPAGSAEAVTHLDKLTDCDLDLHSHICSMSHNDLLIYAFSTAKEAIREFMLTVGRKRIENLIFRESKTSIIQHWGIYNAIKDGDFESCRKILVNMIDYHKY